MKFLSRLIQSNLIRQTLISFIDQALLSATNFIVNIILIRNAAPSEYGLFALSFSIVLLMTGIQNALVNTPMTVLAPKKSSTLKTQFISELLGTQYLLWLSLAGAGYLAAYIFNHFFVDLLDPFLVLVIVLTSLFVLFREFLRRLFFVHLNPQIVLFTDLIYCIAYVALVYGATYFLDITTILALVAMAVACLIAVPYGLLVAKNRFSISFKWNVKVLRETWEHGRFAIMGVLVIWLQSRAFLFLLGGLQDTTAVADIDTIRLVYMPVQIGFTSIASILKPRGAAILATGNKLKLFKISLTYMILSSVGAGLYIITMLFTYENFEMLLFNRAIPESVRIVGLWGILFTLQSIMLIFTVSYQILELFKLLFYIGVFAATVSILATYWGIHYYQAPGSLYGPIIGRTSYIVLLSFLVRKQIFTGLTLFFTSLKTTEKPGN